MRQTLAQTALALETARYRGTGGVSENNRSLGFQPAFIDRETETVHLSRFPDGRLAPCHLLDGLPAQIVLARDGRGRVTRVKASLVSGFRARRAFLHSRRGSCDACIGPGVRPGAKPGCTVAVGCVVKS